MKNIKRKDDIGNAVARLCLLAALTTFGATSTQTFAQNAAQNGVQAKNVVVVEGVVYEKATGEILPGASIAVYVKEKLLTGTSADIDGKFKISVPAGNFEIKVSYMGMVTQTITSKTKGLGNLKVFLDSDTQTIQDVVVKKRVVYGFGDSAQGRRPENGVEHKYTHRHCCTHTWHGCGTELLARLQP